MSRLEIDDAATSRMIDRLEKTYEFQDGADLYSTSSSSSPATTILANNSEDSEFVSRTIAAIISEGEPTYWATETKEQVSNNEPSIRDELESAKASRRARNTKRAKRRNRVAQRAIDQANALQNQAGTVRGHGDQGGHAAGNNQVNHYGDNYRRNLFKDFGNVEQV